MASPITDLSQDTAALVECLAETPVGQVCTWGALDARLGRKVRNGKFYVLQSALRVALRDHGAIFVSVRGEGYKRLRLEEAHLLGARARQHVRRSAKRTSKALRHATARANDMPDDAARKVYREIGVLGLIAHVASDKAQVPAADGQPTQQSVATVARQFLDGLTGGAP